MQDQKFLLILLVLISIPPAARSQVSLLGVEETALSETADAAPAPNNVLDDYIDNIETEKKAKTSARKILEQKPNILRLRENEIKALQQSEKQAEKRLKQLKTTPTAKGEKQNGSNPKVLEELQTNTVANEQNILDEIAAPTQTIEKNQKRIELLKEQFTAAPLGLLWGTSVAQTKELGFELAPAERKDYKNVFLVENPQQNKNTFRQVSAIFGLQDKLWCIYAVGNLLDDTPSAAKVMALYNQYYEALSKKYGNARQFFTPYTYEKQVVEEAGNQKTVSYEQVENPIGGEDFLAELQSGKAVLYATFNNDEIGVTLAVSVDGSGKSYISMDYKNLQLMQDEQATKLNQILDNL